MKDEVKAPPAFPEARAKKLSAKKALWLTILFGVMVLMIGSATLGAITGYLDAKSGVVKDHGMFPWLTVFILTVVFPLTFWWSLKYWRSIDEMARRAHLDAFYWGATISWMVITPIALLPHKAAGFTLPVIEALNMNASQVFGLGIAAAMAATLLGYIIAWLVWWATKR